MARAGFRVRRFFATVGVMVPPSPSKADQKGMWCDDPIGINAAAAPATVSGERVSNPLPLRREGGTRIRAVSQETCHRHPPETASFTLTRGGRDERNCSMHIEPGLVDATKLGLSYATGAASLSFGARLALNALATSGVAATALRTVAATVLTFIFF
jgi:hypothetical protein